MAIEFRDPLSAPRRQSRGGGADTAAVVRVVHARRWWWCIPCADTALVVVVRARRPCPLPREEGALSLNGFHWKVKARIYLMCAIFARQRSSNGQYRGTSLIRTSTPRRNLQ